MGWKQELKAKALNLQEQITTNQDIVQKNISEGQIALEFDKLNITDQIVNKSLDSVSEDQIHKEKAVKKKSAGSRQWHKKFLQNLPFCNKSNVAEKGTLAKPTLFGE